MHKGKFNEGSMMCRYAKKCHPCIKYPWLLSAGSATGFQSLDHLNKGMSSGVNRGRGAECPPETFHWENFGDKLGKMRQGEK